MDLFGVTRSHYIAQKDEASFDMNVLANNQTDEDALRKMVGALRRFNEASQALNLLDALESHYKGAGLEQQPQQPETTEKNEN